MMSKQSKERARLLAVELVRVEKTSKHKTLREVLSDFYTAGGGLKEFLNYLSSVRSKLEEQEKQRQSWDIPGDTRLNSQFKVPNINLPRARSGI